MSRFSISILVVGLAIIAAMIWYDVESYEAGKALNPFHFGRTIIAQIILGIGVLALIATTPIAIFRSIRRKRYQPVAFIALTVALCFIASFREVHPGVFTYVRFY